MEFEFTNLFTNTVELYFDLGQSFGVFLLDCHLVQFAEISQLPKQRLPGDDSIAEDARVLASLFGLLPIIPEVGRQHFLVKGG